MLIIYLLLIILNRNRLYEFTDVSGPFLIKLSKLLIFFKKIVRKTLSFIDLCLHMLNLTFERGIFLDNTFERTIVLESEVLGDLE